MTARASLRTADSVLGRVAEILGVEQEQVEDAFDQAVSEQLEQRVADGLAKLVEMGVLTQDEADAQQAWLDARPEILDFPGFRGYGAWRGGFHGKGFGGYGGEMMRRLRAGSPSSWRWATSRRSRRTPTRHGSMRCRRSTSQALGGTRKDSGERGDWRHGKEGYGFGGKR